MPLIIGADQCGSLPKHQLRQVPDLFFFGLGNRDWMRRHGHTSFKTTTRYKIAKRAVRAKWSKTKKKTK